MQYTHTLSEKIIAWYQTHKRDLPWRNSTDPYIIWVSEIILQQTRVNQGIPYFNRFIHQFPNVKSLAEATEDDVLKLWQGLGYYTRARNMHRAAKQIMERYQGSFPSTGSEILSLSGIGNYTASAIGSFAFNLPMAVVDGNVYRVLSRLFGIETPINSTQGAKQFQELANQLLLPNIPAIHNQAMMEFGALQCIPQHPNCEQCVLVNNCVAFANKSTNTLPVKLLKTKVKEVYINYMNIRYQQHYFLQQRNSGKLWKNLYEFPILETNRLLNESDLLENPTFQDFFQGIDPVRIQSISKPVKHLLSHRKVWAQVINIHVDTINDTIKNLTMVSADNIDRYAISRLMEILLNNQST